MTALLLREAADRPILPVEIAACSDAARFLKMAGFELHCVSMKSEACYYRMPGREGLIRIAAHSGSGRSDGMHGVKAHVTLAKNCLPHSEAGLRIMVAQAIGLFMIAASQSREG